MSTSENCDGIMDGNLFEQLDLNENNKLECCANCGKGGSDINNTCNKCKVVKYCNAACKKRHRSKHKAECEKIVKRAAEIQAELHDEKLFKQPPPPEDCPICMLTLPPLQSASMYMACCGKLLCSGCIHAPEYDNLGNEISEKKCPFCRTPFADSDEEILERNKKRAELGDAKDVLVNSTVMGDMACHKIMLRHLNYSLGQAILVIHLRIIALVLHFIMAEEWKGIQRKQCIITR